LSDLFLSVCSLPESAASCEVHNCLCQCLNGDCNMINLMTS
jgi:hypothetical protein